MSKAKTDNRIQFFFDVFATAIEGGMMSSQDWMTDKCPINTGLLEEDRVQCDECNKIECPLETQELIRKLL